MALTNKLSAIGNAIREKTGGTDLLTLDQMPTEISNIQGGGTVEELTITSNGTYNPPTGIDGYAPVVVNVPQDGSPPESAFVLTGNCQYRFAYGGWDWFINQYGNQIITKDITNITNMFIQSQVKQIPFDINVNINSLVNMSRVFSYMSNLEAVPYIIGGEKALPTSSYSGTIEMSGFFQQGGKIREIPNDYFWKLISNKEYWEKNKEVSTRSLDNMFYGCNSLRELPDISMLGGAWTSQYSTIYSYCLYNCYSLNKVKNFPVCGKFPGNAMNGVVKDCNRIKDFTFIMNEDGTPKAIQWKNQTLDLSQNIGYTTDRINIIYSTRNSGITADKEVKDDATYQALKNDPDWFSCDINYSRYNHDSAVNTINSLPDTSAYLATAGGTNTIKFEGQSGALTDGGAINTLTEEEIAVATAKGWTVSLV